MAFWEKCYLLQEEDPSPCRILTYRSSKDGTKEERNGVDDRDGTGIFGVLFLRHKFHKDDHRHGIIASSSDSLEGSKYNPDCL